MNPYLSQPDLDKIYKKELRKRSKSEIKQSANRPVTFNSLEDQKRTIFLCHSHADKTIVNKAIVLFEKLEMKLYIDWLDESMPPITDKATAITIKSKIENCNKFIFLATYSGLKSKWCNWELGLAYSSKSPNDYAVLPIQTKSGKWLGNEYLGLYPMINIQSEDLDQLKESDISIQLTLENKISFTQWLAY
jgi:hypothetical protein